MDNVAYHLKYGAIMSDYGRCFTDPDTGEKKLALYCYELYVVTLDGWEHDIATLAAVYNTGHANGRRNLMNELRNTFQKIERLVGL